MSTSAVSANFTPNGSPTSEVSIGGKLIPFGDVDVDAAKTQSAELGALSGWGPMAKVGSIGRKWGDLAKTLEARGVETVADLNRQFVEQTTIADPELAKLPITGVIVLDNPRAVMTRLALMLPIRALPSDKGLTLQKK